jgi:mono/diheme cytochrome c family protein
MNAPTLRRLLRAAVFWLGCWPLLPPAAAQSEAKLPESGRVLLGELNCTACHAASERQAAWILPKAAPSLVGLGSRVNPQWLPRYLEAPQETMPGTTMPDVLQALPEAERAPVAEALTHYLVSPEPNGFRQVFPDRAAMARGETLYHQVGCVACHDPQNGATNLASSVPLPVMAEKWSFDGLQHFLQDPLASRPSGRMPAMNLSRREAADVAQYLLRDTQVPATLELSQFRGRMESLEDLDSAELLRTGPASQFSLSSLANERHYALRFSGWIEIPQAGSYTFHLTATGASRLSVADGWRLGQDSWQREQVEGRTTLRLDPGWYPVLLDYVQRGSKEPSLQLEWEGPDIPRGVIPAARLRSTREPVSSPPHFVVDTAKVEKGREFYARLRCAECHEAKASNAALPALAALDSTRGCLGEIPSGGAPDFHLTPAQRTVLRVALTNLNRSELPPPSPKERLAHTLTTLRCTVCHSRDGVGGVSAERDAYFTSNGADLGDEGRIPPRLEGVGDKLRPAWLTNVLTRGASVRPYLNTRMPQFGAANVGNLPAGFESLDRRAQPLAAAPDSPEVQREAGRRLVGTDGLSCIACHRFNRQPAHALQVIDLTTTPERLNEDWFRRFLLDPNRFNDGTRMPAFWPDGVSPLPAVCGGSTERQFAALWTYLADGSSAKFPEGLSRQSMEIVVGGEAVVYRGKLWEAGFRAVAVGYPGQLNAAFDAEEMRLALLWRGRFLDAGPHWGVQGMGQIRPLGTEVVLFPHGSALAVLPSADAPWPSVSAKAIGMRFRGYQLDTEKRPRLFYAFGSLDVEDFLSPGEVQGKAGLRRTLTLTGAIPNGLHLRLAAGKLTSLGDNSWRLDDRLTLRVTGDAKPILRGDGGQRELLVPAPSLTTGNRWEVNYVW